MKHTLLILIAAFVFAGCQKELISTGDPYLETVKSGLKDSLSAKDFDKLDFSKARRSQVDSINLYVLRVPLLGSSIDKDFIVVKTTSKGRIERGKIIQLEGKVTEYNEGTVKRRTWEGGIEISSSDRRIVLKSPVVNGYITVLHSSNNFRSSLVQPSNVMPEVVITYVISSSSGFSWSNWMMLQNFFYESGGFWGNYYGPMGDGMPSGDPGGGGGGSTGGGGNPIGGSNDPVIQIDVENQDSNNEIDITKFINCFNAIPDAGSNCSIEIFTDIPVDANPNTFFDVNTGSPGHVFVNVRKSNGSQSASQNIGFYPKSGYKAMTYAPTAGKLVNNEHHEFNASFKLNLTPAQLNSILIKMQQWSNLNYDVDEYNCTDWAVDIFNHVRTNKLEIPLYGIPGSPLTHSTRTPQGLYHKLRQMVNANDPEKANITIDIVKGYAGGSTGPCN